MAKSSPWIGYLDAGSKSTAVVMDPSLETNKRDILLLYNHAKGRILEYNRGIVEPKLRELDAADGIPVEEVQAGYSEALKGFRAPGVTRQHLPAEYPDEVETDDGDEVAEGEADGDRLAILAEGDESDDADWADDED